MNPDTGEVTLVSNAAEARMKGLVPIVRDLTVKEAHDLQIKLYSPCGCGSGKKFKWCCKGKKVFVLNTDNI